MPKIYIGFITYGKSTAKYLPYFLPSLKAQTYNDFKLLAIDDSEKDINENSIYIKDNFPEIDLRREDENIGFAKAYNIMINQAIDAGADYFLALNPDMIFETNLIEELANAMKADKKIGAIQPKILKWDFNNNLKTKTVDSYGIVCDQKFRFRDDGQGKIDEGINFENSDIFGFTGAAVLLNLKAIQDVAFDNCGRKEYFDELMFMYKEDCDLSLRLRLAGWRIILAPTAVAYHNRSAASKGGNILEIAINRKSKSKTVKRWSYLNQWILLLKYKNLPFFWRVKLAAGWYQLKSFIFILIFEQYLLKEFFVLWKLLPEIKKRREQLIINNKIERIGNFIK